MKNLLFVLCIFLLSSCEYSEKVVDLTPKFKWGDRVAITGGFFDGCKGRVLGYNQLYIYKDIGYSVDLSCQSKDGKYFGGNPTALVRESDLVEDVSN